MSRLPILLLLPLGACAVLGGPRPQIENRFARQVPADVAVPPVAIAVTTAAVATPPSSVSITQLSDRGQAALITQAKGAVPITLRGPATPPPSFTLLDHVARHIVVAVRPVAFLDPGDRVDAVRISLEVVPAQARTWSITSWTAASNGQTVIDVGHLSDTQASKIGASAGLAAIAPLPAVTLNGEASASRTRDVAIRDTTDFDAAVDADGRAWLDETAGWRVNLAHNLSMDAVVTSAAASRRPNVVVTIVYPDRKPDMPAAPAHLVETTVYGVSDQATAPICGLAHLTYRVRHIVNPAARATFTEADDEVAFLTGTAEATFLLAPAPYEPTYVIVAGKYPLHYRTAHTAPAEMIFATLDEATEFRDWLQRVRSAGAVADVELGFDDGETFKSLVTGDLAGLVPRIAAPGAAKAAAAAAEHGCRPASPIDR